MQRLTKPTIGCFAYDLAKHEHKIGEFADYDAFFNYNMAVRQLGTYEDLNRSPSEISEKLKELAELCEANRSLKRCAAGLNMLIKAIDGRMVMETTLPMTKRILQEHYDKYPPTVLVTMDNDEPPKGAGE